MEEQPLQNGGNVLMCPAEKIMANQQPQRFDLSRGYLPVLLVAALLIAGLGVSFRVGGWLQTFEAERSAVLHRLDKIEAKLDSLLAASQQRSAKK